MVRGISSFLGASLPQFVKVGKLRQVTLAKEYLDLPQPGRPRWLSYEIVYRLVLGSSIQAGLTSGKAHIAFGSDRMSF